MFISDEIKREILRQNDIVDVVGSYVRLKAQGSGFFGLCPFHSEKTASFSVSRTRQTFRCFGCGKGGNVITFVMEYENMNFPEAIEFLAERAGMKLPEKELSADGKSRAYKQKRLRELYKQAAIYYFRALRSPEGKNGYEYLKGRGLSDDTLNKFGLGFSPASASLYDVLRKAGFDDELLNLSAMFTFSETRGMRDKFWNRVMFPIMDINSKVIAFGGRVMGDALPKYLNSNETLIFDKSRNLYGLHLARRTRHNYMILCEGYMDVIALHQAGFDNAVASLGTSLTPGQASLIARFTRNVIISYDSDGAGRKAALRGIPILKDAGIKVKVLNMEPYKDPDEFIKALGRDEYEKRAEDAIPGFFFEMECAEQNYDMNNPEEKTAFFQEIAGRMLQFEDELERKTYIDAFAKKYNVSADDFRRMINRKAAGLSEAEVHKKAKQFDYEKNENESALDKDRFSKEKLILSWCMEDRIYGSLLLEYLTPEDFQEGIPRKTAGYVFDQLKSETGTIAPAEIISRFELLEEQSVASDMFESTIMSQMKGDGKQIVKAFAEAVSKCKEYGLQAKITETARNNNAGEMMKLIQEKKKLSKLEQEILGRLSAN